MKYPCLTLFAFLLPLTERNSLFRQGAGTGRQAGVSGGGGNQSNPSKTIRPGNRPDRRCKVASVHRDGSADRPRSRFRVRNKDPNELNNLADHPEYKGKVTELRAELKAWTTAQGDDLQPHQAPYPTSAPIPEIKRKPKKKRPKPKSE